MRKETKLILEALYLLLARGMKSCIEEKKELRAKIKELLNPKSQEMPFKKSLEERK